MGLFIYNVIKERASEMLNLDKILELMNEKDIKSVAMLSRKSKISYTTLNYMLSGHDMHVSSAVELAKFFDVPVDYILNTNYRVISIKEDEEIITDTTSFIEAAVSTMM